MTRQQMKVGILIAARVAALRHLAEDTAQAYRDAEVLAKAREVLDRRAADSDIPAEHRRLRRMLFGLLEPPHKGLPPPRKSP